MHANHLRVRTTYRHGLKVSDELHPKADEGAKWVGTASPEESRQTGGHRAAFCPWRKVTTSQVTDGQRLKDNAPSRVGREALRVNARSVDVEA